MKRVGGMAATKEFDKLSLSGYTRLAREKVAAAQNLSMNPRREAEVGRAGGSTVNAKGILQEQQSAELPSTGKHWP